MRTASDASSDPIVAGLLRPPNSIAPDAVLAEGLRSLLGEGLTALERTPNAYASSNPTEIVHVRTGSDRGLSLFCKYEGHGPIDHVHRRGIDYESSVYRELLAPVRASVPRYFGTWSVPANDVTCMVVEAVEDAVPLKKVVPPRIAAAATWLGDFHRNTRPFLGNPRTSFLREYGRSHFLHWMRCAQELVATHDLDVPWLEDLARCFDRMIVTLSTGEVAVIHGEFYPMNILASAVAIHPIDWESAGIGPGEIDLASLTMGWPADVVEECVTAYVEARWSGLAPSDFPKRMDAARVYLCLRMLGNHRDEGTGRGTFFDYLYRTAIACGFRPPRDDRHGARDA